MRRLSVAREYWSPCLGDSRASRLALRLSHRGSRLYSRRTSSVFFGSQESLAGRGGNRPGSQQPASIVLGMHGQEPLYHLVMYGWVRIAGDSELSLRAPSALF